MRREDCGWLLAVSTGALLASLLVSGVTWIVASPVARAAVVGTLRTDYVEVRMSLLNEVESAVLATGSEARSCARIENMGVPVWIRAKVLHSVNGGEVGSARWSGGEGCLSDGWLSAPDGWWYYIAPLEFHAAVPFETAMSVPVLEQIAIGDSFEWMAAAEPLQEEKWHIPSPDPSDASCVMTYSGAAGGTIKETITVEAVQARNFSPDFASVEPWGTVEAGYSSSQDERRE